MRIFIIFIKGMLVLKYYLLKSRLVLIINVKDYKLKCQALNKLFGIDLDNMFVSAGMINDKKILKALEGIYNNITKIKSRIDWKEYNKLTNEDKYRVVYKLLGEGIK